MSSEASEVLGWCGSSSSGGAAAAVMVYISALNDKKRVSITTTKVLVMIVKVVILIVIIIIIIISAVDIIMTDTNLTAATTTTLAVRLTLAAAFAWSSLARTLAAWRRVCSLADDFDGDDAAATTATARSLAGAERIMLQLSAQAYNAQRERLLEPQTGPPDASGGLYPAPRGGLNNRPDRP